MIDKVKVPNKQGTWIEGTRLSPVQYSETRYPDLQDKATGYTIEDIVAEAVGLAIDEDPEMCDFVEAHPARIEYVMDLVIQGIVMAYDLELRGSK